MAEYAWPEPGDRRLIGTRVNRLDGPAKVTGQARYTQDVHFPDLLYGAILHCPHAHARVRSLNTDKARSMPGVEALRVVNGPGSEIQWAGAEVLYLAASSEDAARDALAAVEVDYEVLPHFVRGEDRDEAPETREAQAETEGSPGAAFNRASLRHKGFYGIPTISHNCLEPHGQVVRWDSDDEMTVWASTQAVTAVPNQFAEQMEVPAANVRAICQYIGGGFGSKFSIDRWGVECARMARETGKPVKLMLDREWELTIGGDRPSAYAEIELAGDDEGRILGWRSESWGSGGLGGSGSPPLPYVLDVPDRQHRHVSIPTNVASAKAWRAPNHPQACFLTMAAVEDLAAAGGLDPLQVVRRNLGLTGRLESIYRDELEIADDLMGWSRRWQPRPSAEVVAAARRGGADTKRTGLGLSMHTWGGRGHRSNCEISIHPDGGVEAKLASQDLGTGTRTVIAMGAAETLGLPVEGVKVSIGDTRYPPSGTSGGSTTVGGVSASTRRASVNALQALYEKVAPELDAEPGELAVVAPGRIGVAGDPDRSVSWKRAASMVGPSPLAVTGSNPGPGELTDSGVGGVQMAEVEVDLETGLVEVVKMVAVQDCGMVIDLKTAESQVYGGLIMGISYALSEEKVMDPVTGRMLNVDFESYEIAGIGDVGELVVHMMDGPGYADRPVVGLGEPPVISPGAAIANAVANAIGVRVPYLPLTPQRVLDALDGQTEGRSA